MTKPLKILVSGGAGFIGSHIVDAYLAAGHSVAVIDNLSTGMQKNVNPKARFYKADITDAPEVKKIFQAEQPDIVNHQAAIVSVVRSASDPAGTHHVNVDGTINLITAADKATKFIFASTGGAMYANPKKFPAAETEEATPLSPYGLSKLQAEQAVASYCAAQKMAFTILRYANVFGPRQNPHGESGVIAIFCDQAVKNEQPTIYRKETTRDYVYVGDVVKANLLALTKGEGEIINIATGQETTNQEVYEAVAREFNWKKEPLYKEPRPGELLRSVLDPAKARQVLGWEATTGLAQGIKNIHHA